MHMLQALLQMLLERKEGFIRYALDESGQRQGAVFLVHSHGMLIYLLAAHTPAGKKKGHDHLIDSVLQEYAEKEKLFDFEGEYDTRHRQFLQQLRCTGGSSGV